MDTMDQCFPFCTGSPVASTAAGVTIIKSNGWLGKFVSQAPSAHRLVRAAQYDEALMLVRDMMEIANLLWLIQENRSELTSWKADDRRTRLNQFGPAAVRRRLDGIGELGPPVDNGRYAELCDYCDSCHA